MKHSLVTLSLAAFIALAASTSASQAAGSKSDSAMSVKVLSVSPPTDTKKHQLITVRVRYTGLVMDPRHIGKKTVAGHGHMQIYLDRVPSSAYQHSRTGYIVATATTSTFTLYLTPVWRKAAHGRHTFLIAPARNDYTLYNNIKPASFRLTVK